MTAFNDWLDTFIKEKNIDTEQNLIANGPSGDNIMPVEVVVEAIKGAPAHEQDQIKDTLVMIDPVRDKPRRSGRGRIARTAQPSLSLGFSVGFAAARCTGARWKSARRRSLKRNRTATTARLSSSASGCRAVPSAAGDWRRL
ncbi:MAG: hypothetical protein AWU57_591 [Marinobacter sp. T13-3]|nr:MAG: hypothetical protein AWU57_591 [Marinobacter sp. T13-3]